MPLHIFEARYRALIGRCLERGEPFGIVRILAGRDTGPLRGSLATVGTSAAIRRVGRYADGRMDIVIVGERRFRIVGTDPEAEAWLTGAVEWLEEPEGAPPEVLRPLADRIGRRLLDWLERLGEPVTNVTLPGHAASGPARTTAEDGPPTATDPLAGTPPTVSGVPPTGPAGATTPETDPVADGARAEIVRRQLLLASARRLLDGGDPATVAWRLAGLATNDLPVRQELLEIPDTAGRLDRLRHDG